MIWLGTTQMIRADTYAICEAILGIYSLAQWLKFLMWGWVIVILVNQEISTRFIHGTLKWMNVIIILIVNGEAAHMCLTNTMTFLDSLSSSQAVLIAYCINLRVHGDIFISFGNIKLLIVHRRCLRVCCNYCFQTNNRDRASRSSNKQNIQYHCLFLGRCNVY